VISLFRLRLVWLSVILSGFAFRFVVIERGDLMVTMSVADIVLVYCQILGYAFPLALVFGLCNIAVSSIITAAFGGGIRLGGRK